MQDVGSETSEGTSVSITWVVQQYKMHCFLCPTNGWTLQLWIVYTTIGKNQYPHGGDLCPYSSLACCNGTSEVHRESKDWHASLHNSSSSVIRTWRTLTLLMTPHMLVDTTGKCHAMLVSDRPLFQILSPNYYWIFIQINCHFSGGEKCTPIFHKEHLSEQAAGQDGFGNCARQVQQTLGHHPRPGKLKQDPPQLYLTRWFSAGRVHYWGAEENNSREETKVQGHQQVRNQAGAHCKQRYLKRNLLWCECFRQELRLEPRGKPLKDADTLESLGIKTGALLYFKATKSFLSVISYFTFSGQGIADRLVHSLPRRICWSPSGESLRVSLKICMISLPSDVLVVYTATLVGIRRLGRRSWTSWTHPENCCCCMVTYLSL